MTRGFSLVEAAIASTIMAVLVVSGLNASGRLGVARYDQADRARARALADDLVGEMYPKAYRDPVSTPGPMGLDAGEGPIRATYDDVDDYEGLLDAPPKDMAGEVLPGLDLWSREVSVARVRLENGKAVASEADGGFLQVTVLVKKGDKELSRRVFLRALAMDASR